MPRFKPYDCRQSLFVPLVLEDQLAPGTLEHVIHHLIEERIEESWFEELYRKEDTGRPACSPRPLLKVLLFGYSRGILGSRPPRGAGLPGECHLHGALLWGEA